MRIAILETGAPPGALAERFGRYPDMFRGLLGTGYDYSEFDVAAGELPEPGAHDACLITGSPAGVYDKLPWIEPLKAFIREAKSAKLVGVCFGHQIMAETLGGRVEKSERGWGVGLHSYPIVARPDWMADAPPIVALPASHQDQVVMPPPGAELIASSLFTPYAAFAWRDRPAVSFQFHPEFAPDFAKALIEARREVLPDPDRAIASLDRRGDGALVAGWIRRFLEA